MSSQVLAVRIAAEEKALEVLSSFPEKFPEAIVIEVEHVEKILEKRQTKKPRRRGSSDRSLAS